MPANEPSPERGQERAELCDDWRDGARDLMRVHLALAGDEIHEAVTEATGKLAQGQELTEHEVAQIRFAQGRLRAALTEVVEAHPDLEAPSE